MASSSGAALVAPRAGTGKTHERRKPLSEEDVTGFLNKSGSAAVLAHNFAVASYILGRQRAADQRMVLALAATILAQTGFCRPVCPVDSATAEHLRKKIGAVEKLDYTKAIREVKLRNQLSRDAWNNCWAFINRSSTTAFCRSHTLGNFAVPKGQTPNNGVRDGLLQRAVSLIGLDPQLVADRNVIYETFKSLSFLAACQAQFAAYNSSGDLRDESGPRPAFNDLTTGASGASLKLQKFMGSGDLFLDGGHAGAPLLDRCVPLLKVEIPRRMNGAAGFKGLVGAIADAFTLAESGVTIASPLVRTHAIALMEYAARADPYQHLLHTAVIGILKHEGSVNAFIVGKALEDARSSVLPIQAAVSGLRDGRGGSTNVAPWEAKARKMFPRLVDVGKTVGKCWGEATIDESSLRTLVSALQTSPTITIPKDADRAYVQKLVSDDVDVFKRIADGPKPALANPRKRDLPGADDAQAAEKDPEAVLQAAKIAKSTETKKQRVDDLTVDGIPPDFLPDIVVDMAGWTPTWFMDQTSEARDALVRALDPISKGSLSSIIALYRSLEAVGADELIELYLREIKSPFSNFYGAVNIATVPPTMKGKITGPFSTFKRTQTGAFTDFMSACDKAYKKAMRAGNEVVVSILRSNGHGEYKAKYEAIPLAPAEGEPNVIATAKREREASIKSVLQELSDGINMSGALIDAHVEVTPGE